MSPDIEPIPDVLVELSGGALRVPVEELAAGDVVSLPTPDGREVTVSEVDLHDYPPQGELFVVRWWRPAERGEPGSPYGSSFRIFEDLDGRYLGSLKPMRRGELVRVARRVSLQEVR